VGRVFDGCVWGWIEIVFLAVVVILTHYLLVFLRAREGLIFVCFVLFVFGDFVLFCWDR